MVHNILFNSNMRIPILLLLICSHLVYGQWIQEDIAQVEESQVTESISQPQTSKQPISQQKPSQRLQHSEQNYNREPEKIREIKESERNPFEDSQSSAPVKVKPAFNPFDRSKDKQPSDFDEDYNDQILERKRKRDQQAGYKVPRKDDRKRRARPMSNDEEEQDLIDESYSNLFYIGIGVLLSLCVFLSCRSCLPRRHKTTAQQSRRNYLKKMYKQEGGKVVVEQSKEEQNPIDQAIKFHEQELKKLLRKGSERHIMQRVEEFQSYQR